MNKSDQFTTTFVHCVHVGLLRLLASVYHGDSVWTVIKNGMEKHINASILSTWIGNHFDAIELEKVICFFFFNHSFYFSSFGVTMYEIHSLSESTIHWNVFIANIDVWFSSLFFSSKKKMKRKMWYANWMMFTFENTVCVC